MFCYSCNFDLRATPVDEYGIGACPECGRGFEKGNPRSYLQRPQRPFVTAAFILGAVVGAVLIAAIILFTAGSLFWFSIG